VPHPRTGPRRIGAGPGRLTHTALASPDRRRWPGSAAACPANLHFSGQKVGGSSPSERTSERASPEATSEPGRALPLTRLLTAASDGGRYRVSEDVGGLGELVADGVGICAQNLLAQGLPPIRLITSS
jgi:hypothetical protein